LVSFLAYSSYHIALPPFPTRRSSDLAQVLPRGLAPGDVYDLGGAFLESAREAREIRGGARQLVAEELRFEGGDGHALPVDGIERSEEHTSELQSQSNLVCRLLLEKKK